MFAQQVHERGLNHACVLMFLFEERQPVLDGFRRSRKGMMNTRQRTLWTNVGVVTRSEALVLLGGERIDKQVGIREQGFHKQSCFVLVFQTSSDILEQFCKKGFHASKIVLFFKVFHMFVIQTEIAISIETKTNLQRKCFLMVDNDISMIRTEIQLFVLDNGGCRNGVPGVGVPPPTLFDVRPQTSQRYEER